MTSRTHVQKSLFDCGFKGCGPESKAATETATCRKRDSPGAQNIDDGGETASFEKKRRRRVQEEWFGEFPWLLYKEESKQFFCKACQAAGQDNVFTSGKTSDIPKKDNFIKHQNSVINLYKCYYQYDLSLFFISNKLTRITNFLAG